MVARRDVVVVCVVSYGIFRDIVSRSVNIQTPVRIREMVVFDSNAAPRYRRVPTAFSSAIPHNNWYHSLS